MKKRQLLSIITFLFIALGMVSCQTEPIDPDLAQETPGGNTAAAFQVDFNGGTYQATTTGAIVQNGMIMISGSNASGGYFTISVLGTTTGTYTNAVMIYTPSSTSTLSYMNTGSNGSLYNGSVNITSINTTTHKITGTFNFTGVYTGTGQPDIAFTNGIFNNITYTGTITETPSTNALFKVDYDGATYTADSYYASVGMSMIHVTGLRGSSGESIGFIVFGNTEGTYTGSQVYIAEYYSGGEETGNYYGYTVDPEYSPGTTATINITEIDEVNHTISGTFSFTGEGSGTGTGTSVDGEMKNFTNGVFTDVPYITDDTVGDQMKATVDGVFYNYSVDFLYIEYSGTEFGCKVMAPNHMLYIATDAALGLGTYNISNSGSSVNRATFWDASGVEYEINEGTITISNLSGGIATGSYTFNVKNDAGQVIHTVTGNYKIDYDE
ncbi:DUF6252 family protein [Flavobacterium sp. RHBU_3]|uniref:DUF6252 family protein n=1 Tax=Flavobacterium sp. RHBU_3 TaxID=3391184 RepID=UPI003984B632